MKTILWIVFILLLVYGGVWLWREVKAMTKKKKLNDRNPRLILKRCKELGTVPSREWAAANILNNKYNDGIEDVDEEMVILVEHFLNFLEKDKEGKFKHDVTCAYNRHTEHFLFMVKGLFTTVGYNAYLVENLGRIFLEIDVFEESKAELDKGAGKK